MKTCLYCAKEIKDDATYCPHCGKQYIDQQTLIFRTRMNQFIGVIVGILGVVWLFFSFFQQLTGQVSLNAETLLIRFGMPVCLLIAGIAVFSGNVKEEKRLKQKTGGNEDG